MAISQQTVDLSFRYPKFNLLRKWIRAVILAENLIPGEITVIYCSDEYLLSVNKSFLGRDYYTDVITFNYAEGNTISGDIFISIERIRENSDEYEVDFFDELDRVIIHGILHLVGYNDDNDDDSKIMRGKEDFYLNMRLQ